MIARLCYLLDLNVDHPPKNLPVYRLKYLYRVF